MEGSISILLLIRFFYYMETKVCSKCGIEKSINEFYKYKKNKDGYRYICKECDKEYCKKYRNNSDNKEKIKIYNREYSLNPNYKENKRKRDKKYYNNPDNKEKINIRNRDNFKNRTDEQKEKNRIRVREYRNNPIVKEKEKKYRDNPMVKENAKIRASEHQKNNKEKRNTNFKNRLKTDPLFKTKNTIRGSIQKSIKQKGYNKKSRTHEILGCSYDELMIHLELQFEPWMNWDNHGKYEKDKFNIGWDIDHIIPLDSATTEEDLIKLNHHTNLQPLCSKINRDVKRNYIEYTNPLF